MLPAYETFINEERPTSLQVQELAENLHTSFPSSHLDIQDYVWRQIEDTAHMQTRKITSIAYEEFKKRYRIDESMHLIHKPNSTIQKHTFNLQGEWQKCFPRDSFAQICISVLGGIPPQDTPLDEVLVIMLNILTFNLTNRQRQETAPPDTLRDYTMSIIGGIGISHNQFSVDYAGMIMNGDELSIEGQKIVLQRTKDLNANMSLIDLKKNLLKESINQLMGLCNFLHAAYGSFSGMKQLELPLASLFKVTPQDHNFSQSLCEKYLKSSINMLQFVRVRFQHKPIDKLLEKIENDTQTILRHVQENGKKKPSDLFLYTQYKSVQKIIHSLVKELELIFMNNRPKSVWLFPSACCELGCVLYTMIVPLNSFETHIRECFSEFVNLSLEEKTLRLPDSDRLLTNLTHLYEKRTVIASYLDVLRQGESKGLLLQGSNKGSSLQETLIKYATSTSRLELAKLITILKATKTIETSKSGDLLRSCIQLNTSLDYYLDELIEKSIIDAQLVVENTFFLLSMPEDQIREAIPALEITINNTNKFLEAVAWLHHYLGKQRIVWSEELITAPAAKTTTKKKSTSKGAGQKKKAKEKNNRKATADKSEIKPDLEVQTFTEAELKPPPQPIFHKTHSSEDSSSVENEDVMLAPTAAELWNTKVANFRALREIAKRITPVADSRSTAFQEILQGVLRNRSASHLSWLRKQKIDVILTELKNEGWVEDHVTGDHHIYKHPCLIGSISIPYSSESDQLKPGTFKSIARSAGWKQ
jgi:predicted RNA binding protein YcfA (HicA-like mRNA interferase family)